MNRYSLTASLAAMIIVITSALPANAQTRWSAFAVDNDWSNDDNWDNGFVPDSGLDSAAIIGSDVLGAALSADVTVDGVLTSPSVEVATSSGSNSSLTIPSGNSLTTVADLSVGDFRIGDNGALAVVNVAGTLAVARSIDLPTGASFDSTLSLTGSATLSAQYAFLDRQLQIVGENVSFTTSGVNGDGNSLILGGGGVHNWQFGAAGPSQLNVNGNLDLGGTLKISTPGYTPAVGSSWVLADSVAVDANDTVPSGFGFIDDSEVLGLSPGATFVVESGATGTIGVLTELTLEQHPVLVVDRQTGMARLKNYSSSGATISFDAYDIRSGVGALDGGALAGLASQNVPNGTWYTAAATANGLGELSYPNATALAANQEITLGVIFAPPTPTEFGEENEDLIFTIGTPDGDLYGAQIVYEGMPNNTLVLNVDPTTGEAQLLNPSTFEVEIDSYVISSASGALDENAWTSLQGSGGWYEAGQIGQNQLAELAYPDGATVGANQTTLINLGSPFVANSEEDLVFQFSLVGDEQLRTGKVVYSALVTGITLPGDFNGDNVVDAADYATWRNVRNTSTTLPNDPTPGTVDDSDYLVWRSNYGASLMSASPATSQAAPEPTAIVLGLALASIAALRTRRRAA